MCSSASTKFRPIVCERAAVRVKISNCDRAIDRDCSGWKGERGGRGKERKRIEMASREGRLKKQNVTEICFFLRLNTVQYHHYTYMMLFHLKKISGDLLASR